jgi:hypothetical protein
MNDSNILGAGGYGIVVKLGSQATKLFYNTNSHEPLIVESQLQQKAAHLLTGIIKVPHIETTTIFLFTWRSIPYLCGITMTPIEPPSEFNGHQLHVLLGYDGSDIDTVWLKDSGKPPGHDNPPRGFFASPETLEDHWEAVGSKWTLERAAHTMGRSLGTLIAGGIVPIDLEFVYGADDEIWLIDFGLCRFGQVDAQTFLHARGTEGLAAEIYIPQEGHRGRAEFLEGYYGASS